MDFKVNKSLLHSTFKELKPVWIHIPSKRSGTHRGFNKGIAFVKFSSEEIQKQAIKEFNGREINGREIVVDVAINTTKPKNVEVSEEAS